MMQIYTLPALARALGVTYPVMYSLRSRGFLRPHQVNGSREYYTLTEYEAAAARSVEERHKATAVKTQAKKIPSNRIDYDALFSKA